MNSFEIIRTVRLTEKGTRQGEKYNQYTVMADPRANKTQIRAGRAGLVQGQGGAGQHAERARQAAPPAHQAGRPVVELEEGHRDPESGRQDCPDLALRR